MLYYLFLIFPSVFSLSLARETTKLGGFVYSPSENAAPIGGHECYDQKLISILKKAIPKAYKIADFGAGLGHYSEALKASGYQVDAFDGAENIEKVTKGKVAFKDLAVENLQLPTSYDFLISLEVGEHIPKEFESNFLKNIVKANAKYVLLSWAVPGQGGFHHVNCQSNDYIKAKMAEFGYKSDLIFENLLRAEAELPWFKKTLMFFVKN